jgi:hypothetical protein
LSTSQRFIHQDSSPGEKNIRPKLIIWLKEQVIISPSYLKYAENEHEPGEGAAAVLILHNRSFQYLYPENFTIFSSFQKQVIKTDI